jgi:SAM-dependent methyltransferase
MKNAFNQNTPSMDKILENQKVRTYIQDTLVTVLETLGARDTANITESVLRFTGEKDYERKAHEYLETQGVTSQNLTKALSGRAELIYKQIKDLITKGTVLDYGCGDGKVGERLSKDGLEVVLSDVYKHAHIAETNLPFVQFAQGESMPDKRQYDHTLLFTVMHHSDNPIKTLQDAKSRTKKGGRIYIIESVYGIGTDKKDSYKSQIAEDFKKLNPEEQRSANIFFDHFYNRVIHYSSDPKTKVNVPFNFRQPEGKDSWQEIFKENGLKEIKTEYLGIDQAAVPEYHTLHVVEVE